MAGLDKKRKDLPDLKEWLIENRLESIHSKLIDEGVVIKDILELNRTYLDETMIDLSLNGLQKSRLARAWKKLRDKHGKSGAGTSKSARKRGHVIHVIVSPEERDLLKKVEEKHREVVVCIDTYGNGLENLSKMVDLERKKVDASFKELFLMLKERQKQLGRKLNESITEKSRTVVTELEKSRKYSEEFREVSRTYARMVKDTSASVISREAYLNEMVKKLIDESTLISTEPRVTLDLAEKENGEYIFDKLALINSYEKPVGPPIVEMKEAKPTDFILQIDPSRADAARDGSAALRVTEFILNVTRLATIKKIKKKKKIEKVTSDPDDEEKIEQDDAAAEENNDDEEKDLDDSWDDKKDVGVVQSYTIKREHSSPYTLANLKFGTDYMITARSINSHGMGIFSIERVFKTLKPDLLVVSRGTHSSSWGYSTGSFSTDAVAVIPNKDVLLRGSGLWLGTGTTKMIVNVYKGENTSGSTPFYTGDERSFVRTDKNTEPVEYRYRCGGILMKAGEKWTIENKQQGSDSYRTSSTSATSIVSHGVSFAFSKGSNSPNGTLGQVPCLYWHKI